MLVISIFYPVDQSSVKIILENGDVLFSEINTLELMVNQKISDSKFLELTAFDLLREISVMRKIKILLENHNFNCDKISDILKKYENNIVN